MKTPLILLFLYLSLQLSANELKWVDEQIKAIEPPRVGLQNKNVAKLTDPFLFVKSKDKAKKKATKATSTLYHSKHRTWRYPLRKLHLSMTMNKSAKINGKWYKIGDTIHRYKIFDVKLSKVTLRYHKKNYLLSTESKNKNLNFKN